MGRERAGGAQAGEVVEIICKGRAITEGGGFDSMDGNIFGPDTAGGPAGATGRRDDLPGAERHHSVFEDA
jgi:hypothetical protein